MVLKAESLSIQIHEVGDCRVERRVAFICLSVCLFSPPTATVCSQDNFKTSAVPSANPSGIKSQISVHFKDNFNFKNPCRFSALVRHSIHVPVGLYLTC